MKSLECHKSPAHKPYILQQNPGVANRFYTKGTERLYGTVTVSKWSCSPPSQEGRGEREEQRRVCRPGTPILIPWVGVPRTISKWSCSPPPQKKVGKKGEKIAGYGNLVHSYEYPEGTSNRFEMEEQRRVYDLVH
jgi:hypothetical protein